MDKPDSFKPFSNHKKFISQHHLTYSKRMLEIKRNFTPKPRVPIFNEHFRNSKLKEYERTYNEVKKWAKMYICWARGTLRNPIFAPAANVGETSPYTI